MSKLTGHFLLINLGQLKLAVFALKPKRLTVLRQSTRSNELQSLVFVKGLTAASVSCVQPPVEAGGTEGMAALQPRSCGELRGAAAHVFPAEQAWQKAGSE